MITTTLTRTFTTRLEARWAMGTSVCVGLDSDLAKIPDTARKESVEETLFHFSKAIVDVTIDQVLCYKIQTAYYEAEGPAGIAAMMRTIRYIHDQVPELVVIADAKRGDIGNTNEAHARALFDQWGFDAVTLHPYFGRESLQPFLQRPDKGLIILCRSSNPGAGEFQDQEVRPGVSLWQQIAESVSRDWNQLGNCGVMVGATYPKELSMVRSIVGRMPILIPGIGAQGGDIQATVEGGTDDRGFGMIINSSRGIIFASRGTDFAEVARRETIKLREAINQYIKR